MTVTPDLTPQYQATLATQIAAVKTAQAAVKSALATQAAAEAALQLTQRQYASYIVLINKQNHQANLVGVTSSNATGRGI